MQNYTNDLDREAKAPLTRTIAWTGDTGLPTRANRQIRGQVPSNRRSCCTCHFWHIQVLLMAMFGGLRSLPCSRCAHVSSNSAACSSHSFRLWGQIRYQIEKRDKKSQEWENRFSFHQHLVTSQLRIKTLWIQNSSSRLHPQLPWKPSSTIPNDLEIAWNMQHTWTKTRRNARQYDFGACADSCRLRRFRRVASTRAGARPGWVRAE
jgi:hypothetical protein